MRRRGERAAGHAPKDRRLLAVVAFAMLLLGVAVGVELYRWGFSSRAPAGVGGNLADLKLPPPKLETEPEPKPEPEPKDPPSSAKRTDAARFLVVIAQETPPAVARRFIQAFSSDPILRKAFQDASRRGLDKTPAREFVMGLMRVPAFRELVTQFRADPGFRAAFAGLATHAEVGEAFTPGSMALVRAPEITNDGGSTPVRHEGGAASGPLAPAPAADAPANASPQNAAGDDAHGVTPLAMLQSDVAERTAVGYFASAFAGMDAAHLKKLARMCDEHTDCDPVVICELALLRSECAAACRRSPKCPRDLRDRFLLPRRGAGEGGE